MLNIEREYYVSSFQEDRKKLTQFRKTVFSIVQEKKSHVTFEQVFRYIFKVNLDKPIDERSLLPVVYD
jgi:Fe2+ or Zn2+ uptake regulation protein